LGTDLKSVPNGKKILSCGDAIFHGPLQRDALEDSSEKSVCAVAVGARPEKTLICDH
jgi:hypothetical protein